MDACMQMILSSTPLLTYQSCSVSPIQNRTEQFNISPWHTVSAFHPFSSFCSTLNVFSQSKSGFLTKTTMIKTINCFNTLLQCPRNPSALEQSMFFSASFLRKHSILLSCFIRWKNDATIISKLQELLWQGLNLCKSALKSYLVWRLLGLGWHNGFANNCGLEDVSLLNNSFTCKNFWRSSNHILSIFQKQISIALFELNKFFTGRIVQTNISQLW